MGVKILSVDTSTAVAGISLSEDNKIIASFNIDNKKNHSTRLMPYVDILLKEFNYAINDFDCFAVSTGPGSFTGLRIGITALKTMSYMAQKPIKGVTTLDLLAYNALLFEGIICPIIDARSKQVYTAIYENNCCQLKRITDYMGIEISELAERLNKIGKKVVLLGDAINIHQDFFKTKLDKMFIMPPQNIININASTLSVLAYQKYLDNEFDDPIYLEPFYLRKSQAERMLEEKQKKER